MVHIEVSKVATKASSAYIWSKLAQYSDMAWHPEIASSRNTGTIEDGSPNMIGAVRVLVKEDGKVLEETVVDWSEKEQYYTISIDSGLPPIVKHATAKLQVRDVEGKVIVDMTLDVKVSAFVACLSPLIKIVLCKTIGTFAAGIASLDETS